MPVEPPSNYCGTRELPLPTDQSFKLDVDLETHHLITTGSYPTAMPTQIDPGNSAFGEMPAIESMTDEQLDGFSIIETCLSGANCNEFASPCPMAVQGEAAFEIAAAAFKATTLFQTVWLDVPGQLC